MQGFEVLNKMNELHGRIDILESEIFSLEKENELLKNQLVILHSTLFNIRGSRHATDEMVKNIDRALLRINQLEGQYNGL